VVDRYNLEFKISNFKGLVNFIKKFFTSLSNGFYKFRDWFWNYPDWLLNIIKKTRPLSYIFISSIVVFPLIGWAFSSDWYVYSNEKQILYEAYLNPMTRDPNTGEFSKLVINPLVDGNNQAEKDIETLVYSPLFTVDEEGKLTYYLAQGYIINSDQTEYVFTLRDDVLWHKRAQDEDPIRFTADDVVFTFSRYPKIGEQNIKVEKIDDFRVKFILPSASPVFLETISLGIVPKHIWQEIRGEDNIVLSIFNQFPIGTGPYIVKSHNTDTVVLVRNEEYFGIKPELEEIHFRLFGSETDLIKEIRRKKIHSVVNPTKAIIDVLEQEYPYFERHVIPLSHNVKMIFINVGATKTVDGTQVPSVVTDPELRRTLSMLIDRDALVQYLGEGDSPAYSPIPTDSWAFDPNLEYFKFNLEKADKALVSLGWKINETTGYREKNGEVLSMKISYMNSENNEKIIDFIVNSFKAGGVLIEKDPQDFQKIASETIQTRNFELLLFEVEQGRDPDPYTLWHSSQVEHPGYNLSQYASTQVDVRLERARQTMDKVQRKKMYSEMLDFWVYDMPALYLFHPTVEYYVDSKISGVEVMMSTHLEERFYTIYKWKVGKRDDSK